MNMTESIKQFFTGEEPMEGLHGLFVETLKDIYHGEEQILKALPKMAKNCESPKLRDAFEKHRQQTEEHIARLEQVFESIGLTAEGVTCEAIEGLVAEGEEVINRFDGPARDAGLLAAAQAVEHYEIARYGTLAAWAREMGHTKAAKLLEATLKEESQTDELLTKLADGGVNQSAAEAYGQMHMGKGGTGTSRSGSSATRH